LTEWADINAIGGALKLWFRLLPGSLLTKELFYEFLAAIDASKSEAQKLALMKAVLAKLPKRNYTILKYLIGHLHRHALASLFYPNRENNQKLMKTTTNNNIKTESLRRDLSTRCLPRIWGQFLDPR